MAHPLWRYLFQQQCDIRTQRSWESKTTSGGKTVYEWRLSGVKFYLLGIDCVARQHGESHTARQGGLCHWQLIQAKPTWEIWADVCLPPWATLSIISGLWIEEWKPILLCFHGIRGPHTVASSLMFHREEEKCESSLDFKEKKSNPYRMLSKLVMDSRYA